MYDKKGIRTNSICPWYIDTPMKQKGGANFDWVEEIKKAPAGRVGISDEVADVIVLLASPLSSFITTVALPVNGGFTAA
jgi:Tropinone reductase 1